MEFLHFFSHLNGPNRGLDGPAALHMCAFPRIDPAGGVLGKFADRIDVMRIFRRFSTACAPHSSTSSTPARFFRQETILQQDRRACAVSYKTHPPHSDQSPHSESTRPSRRPCFQPRVSTSPSRLPHGAATLERHSNVHRGQGKACIRIIRCNIRGRSLSLCVEVGGLFAMP